MNGLRGLAWLLVFQSAGELVSRALSLPLPGPVLGLMFMLVGLRWPLVREPVSECGSFLLAHLAFVFAFAHGLRSPELPGWLAVVVFGAVALLFVLLPRAGALKLPVLVYCLVLAAMVFAAAARHETFHDDSSLRALLGALLFAASDAVLGVRRFVRRFRYAQALILSTYWSAIGLIAWSV